MDYRFKVVGINVRGISIWREDFKKMCIRDYIVPGEMVTLDVHSEMVTTIFCCCNNGCAIF